MIYKYNIRKSFRKDLQILESCSIYLVFPTQPVAGLVDLVSWNISPRCFPMWISKQNPTAERDTIHIPEVDEGRFTGNHNNCWEKPWFPYRFSHKPVHWVSELEISQTKPSSAGCPKYTSNHIPTGLAHWIWANPWIWGTPKTQWNTLDGGWRHFSDRLINQHH
jgi:hypothetical protein